MLVGRSEQTWGRDVTVDGDGNPYLVGDTREALGSNSYRGDRDPYIAKIGPSGSTEWIDQFGGKETDEAIATVADGSGSVYVTGETFSPIVDESDDTRPDGFVSRYDTAGNRKWIRGFGGGSTSVGDIAEDANNDIYIGGKYVGERPDGTGGAASFRTYDRSGQRTGQGAVEPIPRQAGIAIDVYAPGAPVLGGYVRFEFRQTTEYGQRDAFVGVLR